MNDSIKKSVMCWLNEAYEQDYMGVELSMLYGRLGLERETFINHVLPELIVSGLVYVANTFYKEGDEVVMLTGKTYPTSYGQSNVFFAKHILSNENLTRSTKHKKPCKECPYRKNNEGSYTQVNTSSPAEYDGTMIHDCHILSKYNTIEDEGLGCLGSAWIAMKSKGYVTLPKIKEFKDLEEF